MSPTPIKPQPSNPLNDFVRQYCAKHDLSLEKLAQIAGISRGTLYGLLKDNGDAKTM